MDTTTTVDGDTTPTATPTTAAAAAAGAGGPAPTRLPVDRLQANLRNVRRHLDGLDELVDSVRAVGVLQPLTVAPHPDTPDQWVIIAGHRRHAAAQRAGVTEVPVVMRADLSDPVDVVAAMLAENLHRADLTPIEEAAGYQQLLDLGLTETAVAARTGRSRTTVGRRLSLLGLPEGTRERVHARQVTLDQALVLTEFADDPPAVARLEAALDTFGDLRHAAERERGFRDRHTRVVALRARLAGQGWTLACDPDDTGAPADIVRVTRADAGQHMLDTIPGYGRLSVLDRAAAHADCPHRAAYVTGSGQDWVEICLHPITHTPTLPRVGGSGGATAGEKVGPHPSDTATEHTDHDHDHEYGEHEHGEHEHGEHEHGEHEFAGHGEDAAGSGDSAAGGGGARMVLAREQDDARADCAAAARVRQGYLRALTEGRARLTDRMRAGIARHLVLLAVATDTPFEDPEPVELAVWLGIDVDAITDNGGDEHDIEHALLQAINQLGDPHRGLLAALAITAEHHLDTPNQWTPTALHGGTRATAGAETVLTHRAWLDLVTGPLGYQPTPWETDRLTTTDNPGR